MKFSEGSTLNLILSLFAKILNTVAWASAPLLMSEMAPTTVRNMCIGLVSTAGEIGSVFAPYLKWIVGFKIFLQKKLFNIIKRSPNPFVNLFPD
jgi:hypothetical protein